MANKSQGTWYVSFELPPGKRRHPRATETFPNEREAKKFARAKLAQTKNVSAGTLNPHLPKQTIASAKMLEWLDEEGMTVWIYIDTRKKVRDIDHLKVFATRKAAERWFEHNDPMGVAFEYEVLE
jgi:hypothetical protein